MITLYVIQGTNNKRYVGITNNLERRFKEHRAAKSKAGQLLDNFTLLHSERFEDYTSARNQEKFLKSGKGREYLNNKYLRPA
jgi:putative endonuclease